MEGQAKIEEAHGLWEIAVVRLTAMLEVGAKAPHIVAAQAEERRAFREWQTTSDRETGA